MQLKKVATLSSPSPALRGTMKNLKLVSELPQLQEKLAAGGDGELPSWSQLALGMLSRGLEPRPSAVVGSAGRPSLVPVAKLLPTHTTTGA